MNGRAMAVGFVGALLALGALLVAIGTCASCGDNATPPAPDAGACLRWSPTICTPAGCCVDAG